MNLRRCPYCSGKVRIIRLSDYKYYIRCDGCDIEFMEDKNIPDLKENWTRWVKKIKSLSGGINDKTL